MIMEQFETTPNMERAYSVSSSKLHADKISSFVGPAHNKAQRFTEEVKTESEQIFAYTVTHGLQSIQTVNISGSNKCQKRYRWTR